MTFSSSLRWLRDLMSMDSAGATPPRDVRMRGFTHRWTVAQATQWLDRQLNLLSSETVDLESAGGRVLAADVRSDVNVPNFERAMMDGFAVQADDVSGASPYNPITLAIVGEVLPGRACETPVQSGQAIRIMTGAPLPAGANAVLPAEQTQATETIMRAHGEVAPGKHVGRRGEDVAAGSVVLSAGRCLRPQDLGLLSSIGAGVVEVTRRPCVRLVITGNELLPPGETPRDCRIPDSNGPMLSALVRRDGGTVDYPGIIADSPQSIGAALNSSADVILVSGGSSVGQEDHAPRLLAEQGELAVHGVAMRPSSPTGLGRLEHRLVFLLPGNPVSCLCAYDYFAGRAIRALGGRSKDWPYRHTKSRLTRKLSSAVGRLDYTRVVRTAEGVEPLATSGASILSSTTLAAGFVIVPQDSEGYPAGAEIDVFWYDA